MIRWPGSVFVATEPIDLRLSFDRLAGLVRDRLQAEPHDDAMFVFHNRARTHLKILWHGGRGYCQLYMRLDRGTYRIPLAVPADATRVRVTERELALLLEGIDEALIRQARRELRAQE
jgi:transposase